jgi:hypothetical protein
MADSEVATLRRYESGWATTRFRSSNVPMILPCRPLCVGSRGAIVSRWRGPHVRPSPSDLLAEIQLQPLVLPHPSHT